MTERRIYVACLASYNAGRLYGRWINADQDAASIRAEIAALLKGSPYPNVIRADYRCTECGCEFTRDLSDYQPAPSSCPECNATTLVQGAPYPSAEEFAIHDHEGFYDLVGEYTGIDEVVQIAEALEEHGNKYARLRRYGFDHDEAIKKLEEDYQGEYRNLEDWAEQYLEETGLFYKLPDNSPLRMYFDYEAFARDARLSGDILELDDEDNGTVHVFHNH